MKFQIYKFQIYEIQLKRFYRSVASLIYGPRFTALGMRAAARTSTRPEVLTLWLYSKGL